MNNKNRKNIIRLRKIFIFVFVILLISFTIFLYLNQNVVEKNNKDNIKNESNFLNFLQHCKTKEECEEYCLKNEKECKEFCKNNPNEKICLIFERRGEKVIGNETQKETQKISMPFNEEAVSYKDWVIWPFCVHGGDHPEGHGGIDFELKKDADIYAACSGRIEYIEKSNHGYGVMINCGNFAVGYNGISNVKVIEGQNVKKGDIIGNPILVGNDYYIHFEINDYINKKLRCPLYYMDKYFRNKVEEIFKKANYPEKSKEPLLCNCEELPYKESMKEK